jgi:starvation-inducible DNA-binding protein
MFEILRKLLSDYYMFYVKIQNYHWNVEGSEFFIWHKQFEDQYNDLAEAIDTVAELIRDIGYKVPANFETYLKYSSIGHGNENFNLNDMISDVIEGHKAIVNTLQTTLEAAQNDKDEVVADFVIERMVYHRKVLWMLKSSQK